MEDVLDLYAQPYDPITPLVCFDEKPLVVHGEVREPLPVKPGYPQRSDCEYERLGTANLFVFVEPLAGRRAVELTEQRTRLDFAQTIGWLVDEVYPEARVITPPNMGVGSIWPRSRSVFLSEAVCPNG